MEQPIKGNPYSYLTAIERTRVSFPARVLLERGLVKGDVLDFGCGYGKDVEALKARGHVITGYDPHYMPDFPGDRKFDTILCFYVLNVLLPEEQAEVLMDVSRLLKPGGKAYFAVRRDLQSEGYRTHKVHRLPTYQCNVRLPYATLFRNDNCEIYEYWHYTWLHRGNAAVSPFFEGGTLRELIVETATAFSIFDSYPVSPGHVLVIPKRLTADYFGLTLREQTACWIMVNRVKQLLSQQYNPDGFNVGINCGDAGGQTVPQVHIHVIPRYVGDVELPKGGVRGVVPGKRVY